MENQAPVSPDSTSVDNDKVLAALSAIPLVGLIVYFAMPDSSDFVKNYAKQGAVLFPIGFILGIIPAVNCVAGPIMIIAIVVLAIQALQENRTYRLPVVADIVDKVFPA